MKRRLTILAILLASVACSHDIVRMTDFNVTLSPENTFLAGEPVLFEFSGEVDNLLFYSGEERHEYRYKDRYSVLMDQVSDVSLSLECQARYGYAGAMDIYVSDSFKGISGTDGKADRELFKSMFEQGMPGWQKLEYSEGGSAEWTSHSYDSLAYAKENFTLAFHWNPEKHKDGDKYLVQRTYWINGSLNLGIAGYGNSSLDLSELEFKTLVMNDEVEDAYHKNDGNGSIVLNDPETAALIFQGVAATDSLDYAIDAWAVSTPRPLNQVANDSGSVIKNQQNYLTSYSYTWEEPGTYTVTFVGTNSNYLDVSSEVVEMKITILEKL